MDESNLEVMSRVLLTNSLKLNGYRAFSQSTSKPPKKTSKAATTAKTTEAVRTDVPGLSSNIVKPKSQPLGPGASPTGAYKVPEYYCYDRFSYHEAEVEMAKYRCPQPSALN